VVCFAGEADGKFSGEFAGWKQAGEFYATLARWTAGKRKALPADELLTQQVRDGVCFIQLHLDPERKVDPFGGLPRARILHGLPGTPPDKESMPLEWKNADLLEAAVPIIGRETVLSTVEIPGQLPVTLAPVCLPYSPEFAPDQPGRGAATLAQIAATSGGKERVEIPQMWADLQVKARFVELGPWLLIASVVLFLLEVFERRTGWMTRLIAARLVAAAVPVEEEAVGVPATKKAIWKRLVRKPAQPLKAPVQPTAPSEIKSPTAETPASPSANIDALRKARERASRRTSRDPQSEQ
jgi:hypothetical protein